MNKAVDIVAGLAKHSKKVMYIAIAGMVLLAVLKLFFGVAVSWLVIALVGIIAALTLVILGLVYLFLAVIMNH
jgi:hypothetical protein